MTNAKHSYKNIWYSSTTSTDPEYYRTEVKPVIYKGFKIYRRLQNCFDVVMNGSCIAQYAGLSGAKNVVDILTGRKPKKGTVNRFWYDRYSTFLPAAGAQ